MPGDHEIPQPSEDATSEGLSRRRLLGGAAAGGAAILASSTQVGRAAAATTASKLPRVPANSGIDHVVVVMMENRSFDHYLGWVKGADGPRAKQKYKDAQGVAHPIWHLDSFTGNPYHDPNHSHPGGIFGLGRGNAFAGKNIRVNAVNPGATLTDRLQEGIAADARASGSTPEAMLETRTRQHPMGRFAEPREIADMVVFLASKRASYVNGAIVSMDGGATPMVV